MLITTSVYIGSSIYSPAIPDAAEYFGVSEIVSVLGLSLFGRLTSICLARKLIKLVVGYGIGPLFLAPITEIPQIGRNLPYIVPLAIFCILQVPTALVDNFAGFCILRFVAGFVSSPPLATGGESSCSLPPTVILPSTFFTTTESSLSLTALSLRCKSATTNTRCIAIRHFLPTKDHLFNGSLRSRMCSRPDSRPDRSWFCSSGQWMEMGFLGDVVDYRIRSSFIELYNARSMSFLSSLFDTLDQDD